MIFDHLRGLSFDFLYLFYLIPDSLMVHTFAVLWMLLNSLIKRRNNFEIMGLIDSLGGRIGIAYVSFV